MERRRLLGIALGYGLAVAVAAFATALRSRGGDPASGGMQSFGDLLTFLALAGLLSLLPTLALTRAVRASERAGAILSWVLLLWGATAPLGALAFTLTTGPPAQGPVGPMTSPAQALGSALGLLRVYVSPLALLALALGRWACPRPPARTRATWALGLEALGVLALGAWLAAVAGR